MNEHIIILTPDDEIQTQLFDGLNSLQRAVDGAIALVGTKQIAVAPNVFEDDNILIVLYENRDFAKKNYGKGDVKVNALSSSLVGKPVYGKVAIVRDAIDGDEKGFLDAPSNNSISQSEYICSIFRGLVNKTRDDLQRLHQIWDNKLPAPPSPFRPLQKRNGNRFQK